MQAHSEGSRGRKACAGPALLADDPSTWPLLIPATSGVGASGGAGTRWGAGGGAGSGGGRGEGGAGKGDERLNRGGGQFGGGQGPLNNLGKGGEQGGGTGGGGAGQEGTTGDGERERWMRRRGGGRGRGEDDAIVSDEWGKTHGSGLHVPGRIMINLWRVMRAEVKLPVYSFHAVVLAVLRRHVAKYDWCTLTGWWRAGGEGGGGGGGGGGGASAAVGAAEGEGRGGGAAAAAAATAAVGRVQRWRCIENFVARARLNLDMMRHLDVVNRTAELARVFGIDFFSVLSRGSQYRVESMMLRLAHSQNYLLISPSRMQ
ncbi:unnamed protein product, partial [Closterium sp. NIES-53]